METDCERIIRLESTISYYTQTHVWHILFVKQDILHKCSVGNHAGETLRYIKPFVASFLYGSKFLGFMESQKIFWGMVYGTEF